MIDDDCIVYDHFLGIEILSGDCVFFRIPGDGIIRISKLVFPLPLHFVCTISPDTVSFPISRASIPTDISASVHTSASVRTLIGILRCLSP